MATEVLHVDAAWPDPGAILRAATVLRAGGLVAFPTETVYGLGANALDPEAVRKIFRAKGRPATNPLIVHVGHAEAARSLVRGWPDSAQVLAEKFWPGPLTLVLPRSDRIPDVVTGGGPTVALRVPRHPVALALLEACDLPLAAPSANRSTGLSPTRGDHVLHSLEDQIDLLLDAGPTSGGLESTVVDLTSDPPRLLRPGLVGVADLEAILGAVARFSTLPPNEEQPWPSPGMMVRHYAPRTPLEIVPGPGVECAQELLRQGHRLGWITYGESDILPGILQKRLPNDPAGYAAQLYAVLHDLDQANLDRILVVAPPDTEPWLAIRDRLQRATGKE